jgi:trimeric autotransporter adhesin
MDSSFATANSIQSSGVSAPQNVYDLEAEYSHSVTDVPYRFVAGVVYDLPFGKGNLSTGNRCGDEVVGGWQLNVLPTFQSGFPVSIRQSSNPNRTIAGNGLQRPNVVSNVALGAKGSLYDRLNGYINPLHSPHQQPSRLGMRRAHYHCVDLATRTGIFPCSRTFSCAIG